MASSESDCDLFLTQSTFREVRESDNSDEDILSLLKDVDSPKDKYQPIVSDISDPDDDMIAASLAVEEAEQVRQEKEKKTEGQKASTNSSSSRFGIPKGDQQMTNISRRRYRTII
jgi:hypothetical protein